jgi:hypothetical protein
MPLGGNQPPRKGSGVLTFQRAILLARAKELSLLGVERGSGRPEGPGKHSPGFHVGANLLC